MMSGFYSQNGRWPDPKPATVTVCEILESAFERFPGALKMDPSVMMWAEATAPARPHLPPPPCYTGHTPTPYMLSCKESRNDDQLMLPSETANKTPRSMSTVASAKPPQQVYIAHNDPRAWELWEQERERERQRREDQCLKTAGIRHRDLALRSSQMSVADDADAVMGLTAAGKL